MIPLLVMLNNLFHDLATAFIVVATYIAYLGVNYAEKNDGSVRALVVSIYPTMLHVTALAFALLLMAGIVRSFTYNWFEWVEGAGWAQVPVLIVKHIILVAVTIYGIYIWVWSYRKVKRMREAIDGRS